MKGVIIAVMVVLAMVSLMVEPGQAITCSQVDSSLGSCIPFLTRGGAPSTACCNGVRSLKAMTPTTQDRRAACGCVKLAATHYKNIRPDSASQLPKRCGVDFGVPISKNVDCKKIP